MDKFILVMDKTDSKYITWIELRNFAHDRDKNEYFVKILLANQTPQEIFKSQQKIFLCLPSSSTRIYPSANDEEI